MRGYNLSDKPAGWRSYRMEALAGDIAGLIRHFGDDPAYVAGHDWGAAVAYGFAMQHPELVRRLAILNVPHTERMLRGFRTARQLRKSWYMFFFQIPGLPEALLRREDFSFPKRSLRADSRGSFSDGDLQRYAEAWSQPGALTAMLNYYRAALRSAPRDTGEPAPDHGADAGDLGPARPSSWRRARRAAAEVGAGHAHRVVAAGDPLGSARGARARQRTACRILRRLVAEARLSAGALLSGAARGAHPRGSQSRSAHSRDIDLRCRATNTQCGRGDSNPQGREPTGT